MTWSGRYAYDTSLCPKVWWLSGGKAVVWVAIWTTAFFMEDFLLEIVTHKLWLFRFEYLADILKSELLGQGRPLTVLVAADKNDSFPILLRLLMRSVGIITYCDSFFDGI